MIREWGMENQGGEVGTSRFLRWAETGEDVDDDEPGLHILYNNI